MYTSTLMILLNEAVEMVKVDDKLNGPDLLNDIIKNVGERIQKKYLNIWSTNLLNNLNAIGIYNGVHLLKSVLIQHRHPEVL